MNFGEALSFSVQALKANPIRSLLTGLGMVIGNASVILVVTISLTSRDYILEQIEGVGSNLVYAQWKLAASRRPSRWMPISSNWPTWRPCASNWQGASWPPPAS